MPIFEYQCHGCGHVFEKLQLVRQSADGPTCPKCQSSQAHQLISRFSSPVSEGGSMACPPSALS
jgi:putative FmdB family regulatory protein